MSKELQDTMHNYPEIGNEILLEAEHRYSSTFVKKKNADDPEEETNILSISLSKV